MKKFDEKIKDLLFDAEMHVSPTVWDKIEQRIDSKPESPRYWLLIMSLVFVLPLILLPTMDMKRDRSMTQTSVAVTEERPNISRNAIETPTLSSVDDAIENKQPRSIITTEQANIPNTSNEELVEVETIERIIEPIRNRVSGEDNNKWSLTNKPISSVLLKFGTLDHIMEIPSLDIRVSTDQKVLNDGNKIFSSSPKCPSFLSKRNPLYAWSNVGLYHPLQSLSTANNEHPNWLQRRKATESGLLGYSASLGIGMELPRGFFLETGIIYNGFRTNFKFVEGDGYEIVEEIINHYDQNGNVTSTDTSLVRVPGEILYETTNRYTNIGLPIFLGYEIPLKPSYNLSVRAGTILNFHSENSGRIIGAELNPVYFNHSAEDELSQNLYDNGMSIAYAASLNLSKDLTDRMSINAGINFQYQKMSQHSDNPVTETYSMMGLQTGLKYRL